MLRLDGMTMYDRILSPDCTMCMQALWLHPLASKPAWICKTMRDCGPHHGPNESQCAQAPIQCKTTSQANIAISRSSIASLLRQKDCSVCIHAQGASRAPGLRAGLERELQSCVQFMCGLRLCCRFQVPGKNEGGFCQTGTQYF